MFQGDLGPALQREVAWLDSVPVEQLLQLSATPTGISSSALAYSCRLLPTSPHSQPHQKGAGKTCGTEAAFEPKKGQCQESPEAWQDHVHEPLHPTLHPLLT